MQSLLTDSFNNNRQQKTIVKVQNKQIDNEEQQEDSKREQEFDNQSQSQSEKPQEKKQESKEELEAMKDAFESDESYLAVTEEIREERALNEAMNNGIGGNRNSPVKGGSTDVNGNIKVKKITKKKKDFHWKIMWVKQQNAIKNSKPLWVKKWLRVKSPINITEIQSIVDRMQQIPNQIQQSPVKI